MKKSFDVTNQIVVFSFDEGLEPVHLKMVDVAPENKAFACLFGFGHRLGDNAALSRSAENNYRVTEKMRRAAVVEMVDHYRSGTTEWNLRTARAPAQNPAVAALATQLGVSYNKALAQLANQALAHLAETPPETPPEPEMVYQVEPLALPAPV